MLGSDPDSHPGTLYDPYTLQEQSECSNRSQMLTQNKKRTFILWFIMLLIPRITYAHTACELSLLHPYLMFANSISHVFKCYHPEPGSVNKIPAPGQKQRDTIGKHNALGGRKPEYIINRCVDTELVSCLQKERIGSNGICSLVTNSLPHFLVRLLE